MIAGPVPVTSGRVLARTLLYATTDRPALRRMDASRATWGTIMAPFAESAVSRESFGIGGGMTSRSLLRMLARRWYVVILGIVLTVAVLWPATHRPGIYWTQVNVVLLPPANDLYPNKLEDPHLSLTALAGVVVAEFNGQQKPLVTASADTTLYGEGKTSGIQVRMPNMGSQWIPLYISPTIDVQVVGNNANTVVDDVNRIADELGRLLEERQETLGVVPSMRVTMIESPAEPSASYIAGSRSRAMGAGALVGLTMTIALAYSLDRYLAHRRSRAGSSLSMRALNHPGRSRARLGVDVDVG